MTRTYSILSWTGWIARRPSGTRREEVNWCYGTTSASMSKVTMWRSRWRCVIKSAYSVSFLLSINIFVWQNVLYFPNDPRICPSAKYRKTDRQCEELVCQDNEDSITCDSCRELSQLRQFPFTFLSNCFLVLKTSRHFNRYSWKRSEKNLNKGLFLRNKFWKKIK